MNSTPLALYTDVVHSDWIDYNGHLNDGFYAVALGYATEAVLEYIEMHADYRSQTGLTWYTAEMHINYHREMKEGDLIRYTTQFLHTDEKRLHIFHHMYHGNEGYLAATCEIMMLHFDQNVGKVVPMPTTHYQRLQEIYTAHKALNYPEQAGRYIGKR